MGVHMFGAESYTNHACGNPPQKWPTLHQFQRPRKGKRLRTCQDSPDDWILNGQLQPLCGARGELRNSSAAPALEGGFE